MTINFYLDSNNKLKGSRSIYLYVRDVGGTIKIRIGEKITLKDWDQARQRAKARYIGSPELNEYLNTLENRVRRRIRTVLLEDHDRSFAEIKKAVFDLVHPPKATDRTNEFFDHYQAFLTVRAVVCQSATMTKYKTLLKHLRAFEKATRFTFMYENIDQRFFDEFTAYLWEVVGLTNNTVEKYLTLFRTFLNWTVDRKFSSDLTYRSFRLKKEKVEHIYLTESELTQLYNYDYSDHPCFDKVRDIFCFQCFTGQRFSDVSEMRFVDIRDNEWHLRTRKTKLILKVPLSRFAQAIVKKWSHLDKLPSISNQKTNQYLKQICRQAGIDTPVTLTRYKAKQRITMTKPKYELVTSHCGRRTFITLSLAKRIPQHTVMRLSGHTNAAEFSKYVVITDTAATDEMNRAWS